MLRLAFDFIITWRETRTRPNAYLREAAHIINGNDFRESDIVLISDFEMPPLSRNLMEQVKVIKRRKTSFFGLVFGNKPEMEYLNLCERYWEM